MKGTGILNRFGFLRSSEIKLLALLAALSSVSCFGSHLDDVNPVSAALRGKVCDVWEGSGGIEHIRTSNDLELFACLGYVHARERAFQIDFFRRVAEGRRSELQGADTVKDDFQMRLLGFQETAQAIFGRMTPAQKERLWAYSHGVNLGFATPQARDAYEFRAFHYQPEPWHPVNTIELLLLQAFDQTRKSFSEKLDESRWLSEYGAAAPSLFEPSGMPWATTVLKPGEYPTSSVSSTEQPIGTATIIQKKGLERIFKSPLGQGSNNWVVAPSRSATGHAWFANDPHLALKRPAFWFWVHLNSATGTDAIGASLPGVPMIASGTNRSVAWGLTNSYYDVADLTLVPKEDLSEARTIRPTIWVRVAGIELPFFLKSFQRTKQGWPVLPVDDVPKGKALVLRWSGYDVSPSDIDGVFEMLKASSASDVDRILGTIGLPSWNFVFADTQGTIGHRVVGKLPKWPGPLPFGAPQKRLSDLVPWTYLTAAEAPHIFQPARGFIATANNRHWPADSALYGGRIYSSAFRAFRIEELLGQTARHDLASLHRIQCDVQAVDARFFVPLLAASVRKATEKLGPLTAGESSVIDQLTHWDFEGNLSCRPCGVYERWVNHLLQDEDLNSEALLRELTTNSDDFAVTVLKTFRETLMNLKVAPDGKLRPWSELHKNAFDHVSDDDIFDLPPISTPGTTNSVNPGTWDFESEKGIFSHFQGASQRLIVEMTSPPTVYSILPGSNHDEEKPDLAAENGPWMKWNRCELEKREFPLDWSQVAAARVSL